MAQPSEYQRQFSFTEWAETRPGEVPPGTALDSEFDAVKTTSDQTRASLRQIQRDDGRLANGAVFLDTLSAEVIAFIEGNGGVLPTPGEGGGTGGSGGGTVVGAPGALFLTQLYDTPKSYSGQGGKQLWVREDETGVEFKTPEAPSLTFRDLTDAPDSYAGMGGYTLRLNQTAGYLEFVDYKIVPGADYARLDQGNDWGGKPQVGLRLSGYSEAYQALGNVAGNVVLDLDAGAIVRAKVTGNVNWALKATPATGECRSFTLVLENAGAGSHSWPLGTTWRGTTPTLKTTGYTVLTFMVFPDVILAFEAI